MAIIVTGFGLSKPKVVIGRGVFVIPIIQRADRLNMRLLKVDVKTPDNGVKNQEGVSLWLDSVVTVQVFSENSTVSETEIADAKCQNFKDYIWHRQQAAISNFLGMSEEDIAVKINDVLQGNLREIVSEMTIADILTNRKQMALSVLENARPDLAKMGLEIVTFNVQDIKDARDQQGHNHGVIEAIGVQQEEIVKQQAEIARAEAARDIAIAKADADRIANEKQVEAQTAIARRNSQLLTTEVTSLITLVIQPLIQTTRVYRSLSGPNVIPCGMLPEMPGSYPQFRRYRFYGRLQGTLT